MILEGLQHVVGPVSRGVSGHEIHILTPGSFVACGTLALVLIASRGFRTAFGHYLRQWYRLGR